MKKTNKNHSVYMVLKNDGFTFISLLLSLTIIILTLPFLIYFLDHIKAEADDNYIQAHHFFFFLLEDLEMADKVYINDNMLYFDLPTGETARIELYEDQIRRRVRKETVFEGHEIYIRDIQSVNFNPLSYGVHVTLTMENGESYEKKIAF